MYPLSLAAWHFIHKCKCDIMHEQHCVFRYKTSSFFITNEHFLTPFLLRFSISRLSAVTLYPRAMEQ